MISWKEPQISYWDLIKCITDIIDLMNPALVCHHLRVAQIALLPADKPYEINALRIEAQQKAWPEYEQFLK